MTPRQASPSEHSHSDNNGRKRVYKACDRCRLKKSKCDGGNPCSRCRADNAICVFGERKKAHNKVYPKGYVEMLEQQQAWLVYGLQELYRRTSDSGSWPGEPLECEANGHPLTHDLLTRLGALDQAKSKRFEESPDAMQQELWCQNAGHMPRQDSSDASSDSTHSPVAPTATAAGFADPCAQAQLPPTPPNISPSARAVKSESQMQPAFAAAPPGMQGVVNPMGLQAPQQQQQPSWGGNAVGGVDDIDMMGTTDFLSLSFDDLLSSPIFNRPVPINCMSYMDLRCDYDDENHFINADAPEIASTLAR